MKLTLSLRPVKKRRKPKKRKLFLHSKRKAKKSSSSGKHQSGRRSSGASSHERSPFLFGLLVAVLTVPVIIILIKTRSENTLISAVEIKPVLTPSLYLFLFLFALGFVLVLILRKIRADKIAERELAVGIDEIDEMDGADFEEYLGQLLEDLGFYDVIVTKSSKDQGVDVMADLNEMTYAFQCKRSNRPVGNKAVQEIIAGIAYYPDCEQGIVVTNNYFTASAEDLAQMASVVLMDRDALIGMIEDRLDGIRYRSEDDLFRRIRSTV